MQIQIDNSVNEIQHVEMSQADFDNFCGELKAQGFDYGQNDTETMDGEAYIDIYWWNDETPENESHGRAYVTIVEEY